MERTSFLGIIGVLILCMLAYYLMFVTPPAEKQWREDLHTCRVHGYPDMYPMHDIQYCYGPNMPAIEVQALR